MGISGLLPFLKNATRPAHVREFKGQTAAIDVYCFLHKGAFGCADQLAQGKPTDFYIKYVMKYINMLLYYDIKPVLVFDGRNLPSKLETEKKRRKNRKENREKAIQFLKEGKMADARLYFQRSVDITPEMAREVIKACHERNIDCIIAPYEADAQLAFLNRTVADFVITEDSDLTLFGCDKIVFKLQETGDGLLYEKSRLNEVFGNMATSFDFEKFRNMCIMSGCDYLSSLPGIGLGKAKTFWSKVSNPNIRVVLPKTPHYLKMPTLTVPKQYIDGFEQAVNTFLYQVVFDPLTRKERPLNDYAPEVNPDDLSYCGAYSDSHIATQLALGNLDIHSLDRVGYFDPDNASPSSNPKYGKPSLHKSMWKRGFSKDTCHVPDTSTENSKNKEVRAAFKFPQPKLSQSTPPPVKRPATSSVSSVCRIESVKRKPEMMHEDEVEAFLFSEGSVEPSPKRKRVASEIQESEEVELKYTRRILGDSKLELKNTTVSRYFGDPKFSSEEIKKITIDKFRRTTTDATTAGAWFDELDKKDDPKVEQESKQTEKSVLTSFNSPNRAKEIEEKSRARRRNPFAIQTSVFAGKIGVQNQAKGDGVKDNSSDKEIQPHRNEDIVAAEDKNVLREVQVPAVEEVPVANEEVPVVSPTQPAAPKLSTYAQSLSKYARPTIKLGGKAKVSGLSRNALSKSKSVGSSGSGSLKQHTILSMFAKASKKAEV